MFLDLGHANEKKEKIVKHRKELSETVSHL